MGIVQLSHLFRKSNNSKLMPTTLMAKQWAAITSTKICKINVIAGQLSSLTRLTYIFFFSV